MILSKDLEGVLTSINTVTFADGACEARSRREEAAMQRHRLVVAPRSGLRPAPTNATVFMKGSTKISVVY